MDKSIRELPEAPLLPDFRNLGIALRILLGGVVIAAAAALVGAPRIADWPQVFVANAIHVVPVLLGTLGLCVLLTRPLSRLPGYAATGFVVALAVGIAVAVDDTLIYIGLAEPQRGGLLRSALLAAGATMILLTYLALRARAMRPAAAEARFAALSARIRPHFLFNSLNAVLSLIRSDPRRAEAALESVADLFRVLMRDPRKLVPLSEEIALSRQYLDLERLRLGEDRLRVNWEVNAVPEDALVPPLMLQPLLENAVYHGIEPADDGGELHIAFAHGNDGIVIELDNPISIDRHPDRGGKPAPTPERRRAARGGNHMALANIRERLDLHFDLDARLETRSENGRYHVRIVLPYRTGR
ncbi:MAG TPA: histidine kinase [Rhodocyclaceae bacterium]